MYEILTALLLGEVTVIMLCVALILIKIGDLK